MISSAVDSSRRSLAGWVWDVLEGREFTSFYDAFGGNANVASFFKVRGYQVFASDILQTHYWRAVATVQNNQSILTPTHYQAILQDTGPSSDFELWADHYFTKDEANLLGMWWHNINNDPEFSQSNELKAMAYSAVYLTMGYWLSFNQYYLQSKPQGPADIMRHYIQYLNGLVLDNEMQNRIYHTDATRFVDQLPADVLWINAPAMSGFRDTNRKTELMECWTQRVTQINLMGVVEDDGQPHLGQTFDSKGDYLKAFGNFLDAAEESSIWVIAHSERLGIALSDLESLVSDRRSIERTHSLEIAYPLAQDTLTETDSLIIAVAE